MAKPTAAQKRYYARVAELGCYVGVHYPEVNTLRKKPCGGYINIHHALIAGKQRCNDKVIPLCTNHHVQWTILGFGYSVHNGTESFEDRYGTQEEMLQWVDDNLTQLINIDEE